MPACCNCNKTEHSLYCLCGGCYDALVKDKGETTRTDNIPHETFDVMEDGEVYCKGDCF